MLKVLETAVAKQAETVDSALRGQNSFPSVCFHAPYMEVLDWELGLSVCPSQTYTTVCISQLTSGLTLQCFSAPELPLTKYRLTSVFVSSRVCVCVRFLSKCHICVPCMLFDMVLLTQEEFLCQCSGAKWGVIVVPNSIRTRRLVSQLSVETITHARQDTGGSIPHPTPGALRPH